MQSCFEPSIYMLLCLSLQFVDFVEGNNFFPRLSELMIIHFVSIYRCGCWRETKKKQLWISVTLRDISNRKQLSCVWRSKRVPTPVRLCYKSWRACEYELTLCLLDCWCFIVSSLVMPYGIISIGHHCRGRNAWGIKIMTFSFMFQNLIGKLVSIHGGRMTCVIELGHCWFNADPLLTYYQLFRQECIYRDNALAMKHRY